MNIDEIDIRIIAHLYSLKKDEDVTTYELAKFIFKNVVSDYELRKKDCFIRSRLDKLAELGAIIINRDRKKAYYMLMVDNCCFRRIRVNGINQKSCCLKLSDKWYIYPA